MSYEDAKSAFRIAFDNSRTSLIKPDEVYERVIQVVDSVRSEGYDLNNGAGSLFTFRTDAAAATIPAGVTTIETLCRATAGDGGGARYVVTASTTFYQFQSADGRRWDLDPNQRIRVEMFGARGDATVNVTTGAVTGTDDTAAIQAAIDWCLRSGVAEVHLRRKYRTSDTIHLGWGEGFVTIHLIGTARGSYSGSTAGAVIAATATDRPAINVQGARGSSIRGLCIVGQNVQPYVLGQTRRWPAAEASWLTPALAKTGNNPGGLQQHSPYAGITIDAYSTFGFAVPTDKYPDVTYPAWTGLTTQYGRNLSSEVTIENCELLNFAVGVCIQPAADGNGDFIRIRGNTISACIYGIAVCNGQSRNLEVVNNNLSFAYAVLTNSRFGAGRGELGGTIANNTVAGAYQLFLCDAVGYSGTVKVEEMYCEDVVRAGRWGTGPISYPKGWTFLACNLQFDETLHKQIPRALFEGVIPITLDNTTIVGSGRLTVLSKGCTIAIRNGTTIQGCATISGANGSAAYQAAINGTGGVVAGLSLANTPLSVESGTLSIEGLMRAVWCNTAGYTLGGQDIGRSIQWYSGTSLSRLPLHALTTEWFDVMGVLWRIRQRPSPYAISGAHTISGFTHTGLNLTFTYSNTYQGPYYYSEAEIKTGDVLQHQATGTAYIVKSITANGANWDVVAEAQTNMLDANGTGTWAMAEDVLAAGTTFFIHHTQTMIPACVFWADLTVSAGPYNAHRGDTYGANMSTYYASGDLLYTPYTNDAYWGVPVNRKTKINAITNASPATITLTQNPAAAKRWPLLPVLVY